MSFENPELNNASESPKDASSENMMESQFKQEVSKLQDTSSSLKSVIEEKGGAEKVTEKMKEAGHPLFNWAKIEKVILKMAALQI